MTGSKHVALLHKRLTVFITKELLIVFSVIKQIAVSSINITYVSLHIFPLSRQNFNATMLRFGLTCYRAA